MSINPFALDQLGRRFALGDVVAWQIEYADNVDATHPLKMYLYIPVEMTRIVVARLFFRLEVFRSYGTGAAAGGGQAVTSQDGGSIAKLTDLHPGWTGLVTQSATASDSLARTTSPGGSDNHTHSYDDITPKLHNHTFDIPQHDHFFSAPAHSHTVSLPDHTHPIVHAIYEGTAATGTKVTINGTDRTAALGGGTGFTANQTAGLDIKPYLTATNAAGVANAVTGSHTIELSSTQLGRIDAHIFLMGIVRLKV